MPKVTFEFYMYEDRSDMEIMTSAHIRLSNFSNSCSANLRTHNKHDRVNSRNTGMDPVFLQRAFSRLIRTILIVIAN